MERHPITTPDGYKLNMMRIVPREQTGAPRKPVFIQHGIASNALPWLSIYDDGQPANPVAMA